MGYEDRGDCVFVGGLPLSATEADIAEYFGAIGIVKIDRKTGKPKIWMYRDKVKILKKAQYSR
jgi:RNA-binding protein FUS